MLAELGRKLQALDSLAPANFAIQHVNQDAMQATPTGIWSDARYELGRRDVVLGVQDDFSSPIVVAK